MPRPHYGVGGPEYSISVHPPLHQARTYRGYVTQGSSCPAQAPADADAASDPITITNIGYDGDLTVTVDRFVVDALDPSATLAVSMSTPRPPGYSITVFDDAGARRYCSTTTGATTIPLLVTPPADQARTYTTYVAPGSCPGTAPETADQSAEVTVYSGIDNPAHADLGLIARAAATTLTSAQTCTELSLSPTATHNAGSSLSDQQLTCEAALAAGKPLKGALAQAVVNTAGAGTVWWLLHQITTDQPVTSPPTGYPDPGDGEDRTAPAETMPTTLDPAWRIDDLTQHLLDHNPDAAMDHGQARTVATHCAWRTA